MFFKCFSLVCSSGSSYMHDHLFSLFYLSIFVYLMNLNIILLAFFILEKGNIQSFNINYTTRLKWHYMIDSVWTTKKNYQRNIKCNFLMIITENNSITYHNRKNKQNHVHCNALAMQISTQLYPIVFVSYSFDAYWQYRKRKRKKKVLWFPPQDKEKKELWHWELVKFSELCNIKTQNLE